MVAEYIKLGLFAPRIYVSSRLVQFLCDGLKMTPFEIEKNTVKSLNRAQENSPD